MPAEALKAKADSSVAQLAGRALLDGRHQVVRHGACGGVDDPAEIGPIALRRADRVGHGTSTRMP
jgi:hypothetical protein